MSASSSSAELNPHAAEFQCKTFTIKPPNRSMPDLFLKPYCFPHDVVSYGQVVQMPVYYPYQFPWVFYYSIQPPTVCYYHPCGFVHSGGLAQSGSVRAYRRAVVEEDEDEEEEKDRENIGTVLGRVAGYRRKKLLPPRIRRVICNQDRKKKHPYLEKRSLFSKHGDDGDADKKSDDDFAEALGSKTSLMIKNIPNHFGRHDMLTILDKHCKEENMKESSEDHTYGSSYDFLYLPVDFKRGANLGYAFVNFTSSVGALRFYKAFHKRAWRIQGTKKVCEIACARYQGKAEFVLHFRNSYFPCQTDRYLPVVLSPPSDGSTPYSLHLLGRRTEYSVRSSWRLP